MIASSILDTIGNTPLVRIKQQKNLMIKLELKNPFGSSKDRACLCMIDAAIKSGKINKNTKLLEASSGNTGIAISAICATKGIPCTIILSDDASEERKKLINAYGAELIITPASEGMLGAISKAIQLSEDNINYHYLDQFNNANNKRGHYSTAQEILQETSGNVDVIFATIGTGGTITGITEYIKDRSPSTKIIGVEPSEFSNIPGIGASKFSNIFRKELLDDIVYVDSEDALDCCKNLARAEGILAGISSGAAFSAAKRYAEERHQEEVVVVFPDSGERYISTGLYS